MATNRKIKVERVHRFAYSGEQPKHVAKIRLQGQWLAGIFPPGTYITVEPQIVDGKPALVLLQEEENENA